MEPTNSSQARGIVLIVEDDAATSGILQTLIVCEKHVALVAATVDSAREVLKNGGVGLLLLDWYLGGATSNAGRRQSTTGRQLLETARALDPLIPIIVMSGGSPFVDVETEALEAGADFYMPKPVNLPRLLKMIARWLQLRKQARQSLKIENEDDIIPLDELRQQYITKVVALLDGNISKAAQKLGVHRHTISAALQGTQTSETQPPTTP